ncbi:MAG: ArsR family transcriptional regulator [Thermoplasmatota archaeon]
MSDGFSKKEEELVERLIKTGLNKNVAKTLVYIAGRDEIKSREIESEIGLRQPEVSIAMQDLREKDWVAKRDIKKEGKGRPVHAYSLEKDIEEIIDEIEEEEKEKIAKIEENIEKIKKLI